ncbi:MAG: hypothetical protein SNJ74_08030 [Fimbriimonadaceae bacterium]
MIRFHWALAAIVMLGALPTAAAARPTDPREKTCIDRISEMLIRVGEKRLASRLKGDYAKGWVTFGELGPGESASAGKDVTEMASRTPNKMTLNREKVFQQVADFRSASGVNPLLLGWAATIAHEYVHMDQVNPTETAKYETPAWLESADAMRRWLGVFQRDYERARSMKEPQRSRLLNEIEIYVGEISRLCASMAADVQALLDNRNAFGVRSPKVDPSKNYGFARTKPHADSLLKNIQALKRATAARPASPGRNEVPKPRFVWRRKSSGYSILQPERLHEYKASADLSLSGAEGVVNISYRVGAERAKFALTWNPVPDTLTPGQTIRVTLKISDTGSTAERVGTGGGGFEVWIQRSLGGPWEGAFINQPMVAILGREAPQSRDYVFEVPDGRPGQTLIVKVGAFDGLLGSEYVVVYACE